MNNYEICREAMRQALLRMPRLNGKEAADTLAKVLREEPHLIVLPTNHGDTHYFSSMSDAVTIWQSCAPGTDFPPPFMGIIAKVRELMARQRPARAVGIELMEGESYIKSEASRRISRTILVHVPIVGGKPSLPKAMRQCREAFMASGLFDNNGGGRAATDVVALSYYRLSQGNRQAKARLRLTDMLRKDEEGLTGFGRRLYAPAIDNVQRSPSESAWSEGVERVERRVMRLADRLMQLVADGHLAPTPKLEWFVDGA